MVQQKYFQMKKQVTFGHILTILAIIIVPLFVWGVNVERRFEKVIVNSEDVKENKSNIKNIQIQLSEKEVSDNANFILVLEKLHSIELQIKDKQDRK